MKRFKANQSGAVLVTVVCVVTVCMIIVATALKLSAHTNAESTKNVCRTQAKVTAENYLQYYLDSFPKDEKTGKLIYDDLNKIAGESEETAKTVTCRIVTNGNQPLPAENYEKVGGTCVIKVYKSNGGIIVRADATYGGQTQNAKAYFNGKVNTPYASNNAVETTGAYLPTEALPVCGDILIEVPAAENEAVAGKTDYYSFMHNSNGTNNGNYYTTGNLAVGFSKSVYGVAGDTDVFFIDSQSNLNDRKKAMSPTITVVGDMYSKGLVMSTEVGKIDYNGVRKGEYVVKDGVKKDYGADGLSNRDGYVNVFGTLYIAGTGKGISVGCKAGGDSEPIDVYCSNLVSGAAGGCSGFTAERFETIKTGYDAILSWAPGSAGSIFQTNNKTYINGNLYVYKDSAASARGDLITTDKITVSGDAYIEGDIYLIGNGELSIGGTLYISDTSKVYKWNSNKFEETNISNSKLTAASKVKGFTKVTGGYTRNARPRKLYAPGLFDYDADRDPDISYPDTYGEATPNDMYKDNTADSKFIKNLFKEAITTPLKGNAYFVEKDASNKWVKTGATYNGDANTAKCEGNRNKALEIDKSCYLTKGEAELEKGIQLRVVVKDKDIVVALPMDGNTGKLNAQIRVDRSTPLSGSAKRGFCYIMFYNENEIGTDSKVAAYLSATEKNYYLKNNSGMTYYLASRNVKTCIIANSDIFDFCSQSPLVANPSSISSNIMILLPDGMTLAYGEGDDTVGLQALIYGPKGIFDRTGNSQQSSFYGQIKVKDYKNVKNADKYTVVNIPPSEGSILTYITKKAAKDGILKFLYYVKNE